MRMVTVIVTVSYGLALVYFITMVNCKSLQLLSTGKVVV